MAGQLLDGARAVSRLLTSVDQTIVNAANTAGASFPAFNVASGSAITGFDEWTCTMMRFSLDYAQATIDKTTFCSGRGEAISPGRRSIQVAVDIIESKGYTVSNLNYLFGPSKPIPIIAALDTDCIFSGMMVPTGRRASAEAWNNYQGGWSGRIDFGTIPPVTVYPTAA